MCWLYVAMGCNQRVARAAYGQEPLEEEDASPSCRLEGTWGEVLPSQV